MSIKWKRKKYTLTEFSIERFKKKIKLIKFWTRAKTRIIFVVGQDIVDNNDYSVNQNSRYCY